MTATEFAQAMAVVFALLAAWAWAKSAVLQLNKDRKAGWVDDLLNRISKEPAIWNAIAAFLAAVAAVAQGTAYLMAMTRR
jgi:hypothetical protein